MAEEKFIYRLAPCPARNIDAMEAWLEEMAADGLLLTRDGFFCGFGTFRKDAPRTVRYRLVPTSKRPSIWNDSTAPDEDLESLWKRYGWEYLTYREDFHIFRTEDPLANIPPYDRESREQALDALSKRYRSSILSGVSVSLLFSMLLEGKSVSETADTVGYPELRNFIRAFKKYYGYSPSQVKKYIHYTN